MIKNASEIELELQTLRDLVAAQAEQIAKMEALLKYYEEQFKLAQKLRFGASSEKAEASKDQISFDSMFNEAEDQSDQTLPEPTYEEIKYKRRKRIGKREDDLTGLPVERIDYELPEEERICTECGTMMNDIGVDVRREVTIIPATAVVTEHARHAYGCPCCAEVGDRASIVTAESPAPLIAGSLASPSAVAHIAVQKYCDGIPLYRQEKSFQYDGVFFSRQTMANWLVRCAQNFLISIYSLLITFLLKEPVLHADETTVQVLHEPGREAQAKSYEWLYRTSGCSGHAIVIYEYRETRAHEHPKVFLSNFKGYLHSDGYQAYHNLPPGIIAVGCWAHARRPWKDLYDTIPKDKRAGSNAELGLAYVNKLFALEDKFRDLSPEERYEKRLEMSKPISDAYFNWASNLGALPKSLLGQAVSYSLSQREYLENVFLDGRLELSNNRAERSIKPFVQGRKQWLFSNTPNGAESSSIIYSIIETAKENRLRPFHYLKYLLETLPNTTTSGLEALLPWSDSLPDSCRIPK